MHNYFAEEIKVYEETYENKRRIVAIICLVLVFAIVAGCGGGEPTQTTTGDTQGTTGGTQATTDGTEGTQNSGTEPTNTEQPDVPKDEPVKLYLLTEQKSYYNGILEDTATFTYDEQGKQLLTEKLSADGTVTEVVSWVYNDQGQLIQRLYYEDASADTPYGTDTFTYSEDGLTRTMTSTLQTSLSGGQKKVIATFDEFGNLLREETVSGSTSTVREFSYRAVRIPADWPRNH